MLFESDDFDLEVIESVGKYAVRITMPDLRSFDLVELEPAGEGSAGLTIRLLGDEGHLVVGEMQIPWFVEPTGREDDEATYFEGADR